MRNAFRSPLLRRIVGAYTVNRLGTWFGVIALTIVVFNHTRSALAVAGLLIATQVIPAFLSPALIARVEAHPGRGMLSALYMFEALVTLAIAALAWKFSYPALLPLVAIDGTAALAANSLLRSEAARAGREQAAGEGLQQVEEAERDANAAINMAFSLTFTLGPAIAGVLVASAGGPVALLIDAVSFAACGALLLDLSPHLASDEPSVRARLASAISHITGASVLRALLIIEAVAVVFFEFAGPVEIAYAKSTLHVGDTGYGVLLTTWGVGVAVGSILFARSTVRGLGAMLVAGTLLIGLAYVAFATAPTLAIACVGALGGGVGNGVQWASVVSMVQRLSPHGLHGQMMGALESLSAICPVIGLLLGGGLVALTSPRGAFAVAGAGGCLAAAAFAWLMLGPLAERRRQPVAAETVSE
jgi:MFS family permease